MFMERVRTAIVAGVLLATAGTAVAQEPQSYTLSCRGGSAMTIGFYTRVYAHFAGADWGGRGIGTAVTIRFRKARGAGLEASVRPGECAWLDRPLNDREPAILFFDATDAEPELPVSASSAELVSRQHPPPSVSYGSWLHDGTLDRDHSQARPASSLTGEVSPRALVDCWTYRDPRTHLGPFRTENCTKLSYLMDKILRGEFFQVRAYSELGQAPNHPGRYRRLTITDIGP